MTEAQLQNLSSRIGANPNLVQNDRMLHIYNPLGGFSKWVVLTYNLQILGDYIKENSQLRKKLDDVVENYVKQLEILCKIRPPDPIAHPVQPYPGVATGSATGATNPSYPTWNAVMTQKLDDLKKRFDKLEELIMEKLGP